MRRVCVYAGASSGADPAFEAAARGLGELLAASGIGLVYGGASIGLMGAVADGVLGAGGEAIGVIPVGLKRREVAHEALSELRTVDSMHERKAMMSELADAFVALPGGLGTLDELLEVATWTQLGIHAKPCGLLNVGGYWDSLLAQLERAGRDGFLRADHRSVLLVEADAAALLAHLREWQASPGLWRARDGRSARA